MVGYRRGYRRRYGRRRRFGRGGRIALKYARAHHRLLRRARRIKGRKHRLQFGYKTTVPRTKVAKHKHYFAYHSVTNTPTAKNMQNYVIQADQIRCTTNTSEGGPFHLTDNRCPFGCGHMALLYGMYRVNALKVKVWIEHRLGCNVHIFYKWCRGQDGQREFWGLNFAQMCVHPNIGHKIMRANSAATMAVVDGIPTLAGDGTHFPRCAFKSYATRKAVMGYVAGNAQAFDRNVTVTNVQLDHGSIQTDWADSAAVTDGNQTWFFCSRAVTDPSVQQTTYSPGSQQVIKEGDIKFHVKTTWYVKWYRRVGMEDQEDPMVDGLPDVDTFADAENDPDLVDQGLD